MVWCERLLWRNEMRLSATFSCVFIYKQNSGKLSFIANYCCYFVIYVARFIKTGLSDPRHSIGLIMLCTLILVMKSSSLWWWFHWIITVNKWGSQTDYRNAITHWNCIWLWGSANASYLICYRRRLGHGVWPMRWHMPRSKALCSTCTRGRLSRVVT